MRNFSTKVTYEHLISLKGDNGRFRSAEERCAFWKDVVTAGACLQLVMLASNDPTPSEKAVIESFRKWAKSTKGAFVYINMNTGVSLIVLPDLTGGEYQLTPCSDDVLYTLINEDRNKREKTHHSAG